MGKIIGLFYGVLFSLGLWIENPSSSRLLALLGLGALACLFSILPGMRPFAKRPKAALGLWLLAPVCLLLLERQSKFGINDFFHTLYFVGLLSLFRIKASKPFAYLALIGGAAMSWKYLYIYAISPETLRIPQAATALSLYGLVSAILWMGLRLSSEQDRLKALNLELEALTAVKERQKMARELHDTLGHELTALTMKLEMSRHFMDKQPEQGMALLSEGIADSRSALRSMREVVTALTLVRRNALDLRQLIGPYASEGALRIDLSGEALMDELDTQAGHVAYRAVQEGITNCLKHSDANAMSIGLRKSGGLILLSICDNGSALGEVEKGFGLNGMAARAKEVGGTMRCSCDQGFCIELELPAAKRHREETPH